TIAHQGNRMPPEQHGRGITQYDLICYKLGGPMRTIDHALASARRRFTRLTAAQANTERAAGALLVDTRTESQRRAEGDIPGALVIDRTVLEWRLDPASASHIAEATDHQVR